MHNSQNDEFYEYMYEMHRLMEEVDWSNLSVEAVAEAEKGIFDSLNELYPNVSNVSMWSNDELESSSNRFSRFGGSCH